MANAAAKVFMNYLNAQGNNASFMNEEESVIRVGWNLNNTKLRILFFFGEEGTDVHLMGDEFAVIPEEKRESILRAINECNRHFRWMKFVLNEEGEIEVKDDAVIQLESCAEECYELMLRMCGIVDEAYPILMKAIWS